MSDNLHIGDKVEFTSDNIIDGHHKPYDLSVKCMGEITAFTMSDTVWVGHHKVKRHHLKKIVSDKPKQQQELDEFIEYKLI